MSQRVQDVIRWLRNQPRTLPPLSEFAETNRAACDAIHRGIWTPTERGDDR